jgi:lysophospholipase L1-like esterase
LAPDKDVVSKFGPRLYRIRTNSLGFKDLENREILLQTTFPRILFMGDSFTEGAGVEFKSTFAGHLADRFAKYGIDLLNAGVSAYSPSIYFTKIRYLLDNVGLKINELIVFIDISDIWEEVYYYVFRSDGTVADLHAHKPGISKLRDFRHFLRDNSILFNLGYRIRDLIQFYLNYVKMKIQDGPFQVKFGEDFDPIEAKMINFEKGRWTFDEKEYARYGERGFAKASRIMKKLSTLLRQKGIGLTIAVYPWPAQIMAEDRESRQVHFWRDWCSQEGCRFVNLFPAFIGEGRAAKTVLKEDFIPGDIHWSEAGHRRVAETFWELAGMDLINGLSGSR